MRAKEYLSYARYLDIRINSKIEQVASLNELATKCTSTISDMPRNPNRDKSGMADAIDKIISLQDEINKDIDALVDLKHQIVSQIKAIPNVEHQTILEKRYLCFGTWEQIAADMGYSLQYTFRVHAQVLKEFEKSRKVESKVD